MADQLTDAHIGRNDPCHCGSGRKYKHCCLGKDESRARTARAKETATASPPAKEETAGQTRTSRPKTQQPWKRTAINTHGFHRTSTPRKVGAS